MDLFNTTKIERLEARIEELEQTIDFILGTLIDEKIIKVEEKVCEPCKREGKEL